MRVVLSLIALTLFVTFMSARTPVAAQSVPTLTPAGEGRRVFLRVNCYGCHGIRAGGGIGPNLRLGAEDVGEIVMQGSAGGMPSFRGIVTSTDVTNLIAYLSSIGTPNEPTFNDWWVPVPTK